MRFAQAVPCWWVQNLERPTMPGFMEVPYLPNLAARTYSHSKLKAKIGRM